MSKAPLKRWRARTNHLIAAGLLTCAGCNSVWDPWLAERCTAGRADMSGKSGPTTPEVSMQRPGLVLVTAGTFLMGSPVGEPGRFDTEEAQHGVKLTSNFWISETEVTQGHYSAVMGANPSIFATSGIAPVLPVENVSWVDAIKYCNQLSTNEGLQPCYQVVTDSDIRWDLGPACTGYRLPTESEWEYAARAGGTTLYAGSDNIDEVAWYNDANGSTHAVKGKKANAWKLYDMTGNVWEWVWDFYQAAYPATTLESPAVDPIGPQGGPERVYRGGSWSVIAGDIQIMRVANRRREKPGFTGNSLGFRIVKRLALEAWDAPADPACP